MDPGTGDLLKRESYLTCSSPASSTMATAPSQTLEEPSTPAAASITSFESIDLDSSPVKRPSRLGGLQSSPAFSVIRENGAVEGLSGKDSRFDGEAFLLDFGYSRLVVQHAC